MPFTHPDISIIYTADTVTIVAGMHAMEAWATRPGHSWPCSKLRDLDELVASFNSAGLFDISGDDDDDLDAQEFNAFTSDAIAFVLPQSHPAWYVAVGQFFGAPYGSLFSVADTPVTAEEVASWSRR